VERQDRRKGERREENGGKEVKEGREIGKRGEIRDFITVTCLLKLESDRL